MFACELEHIVQKKLYKVPHIDMVVFKEPNHRKSEKKLYSKIYQIEGTFL